MDTPEIKEGREESFENIDIVRWSDNNFNKDTLAIPYSEIGFINFKAFVDKLRDKYPDKYYPTEEIIDRINPIDGIGAVRNLVTYIVQDDKNAPIGGIIGEDKGKTYQGLWFTIDPEFQNTTVVKKLLHSVQLDYDRVTLIASTFGYDKTDNPTKQHEIYARRQKALIRYYERLGFRIDITSKAYIQTDDPTVPIPMIWEKDD